MTTGRSTKINDDNKFAGQFGRRLYISHSDFKRQIPSFL